MTLHFSYRVSDMELFSYRVSDMELLILQHKAANQTDDPRQSPVFQLRSLLGV